MRDYFKCRNLCCVASWKHAFSVLFLLAIYERSTVLMRKTIGLPLYFQATLSHVLSKCDVDELKPSPNTKFLLK